MAGNKCKLHADLDEVVELAKELKVMFFSLRKRFLSVSLLHLSICIAKYFLLKIARYLYKNTMGNKSIVYASSVHAW
jgi:hypothetical protein